MKKHVKVYMQHFEFGEQDFIRCELCAERAVDIHHIHSRGMGGSKRRDTIDNLIALCRPHHTECHGRNAPAWRQICLSTVAQRK